MKLNYASSDLDKIENLTNLNIFKLIAGVKY
jgi:hypothetical protein